jgi:predicted metal-dependent HD superfamily phosphohydrolase
MAMAPLARWLQTWRALGAADSPALRELHAEVVHRYAEPHRHYHTLQHLDECLSHLDELREEAEHPAEIELALWFHDAIYDVKAKDNEEGSADWARSCAVAAGIAADVAARVHALILTTKHDARPERTDARIMVDADLAILGAKPARFDEYEQQVRAEYGWVPGFVFRRERRKILEGFLARPTIFNTARFIERYEKRARENLSRSIGR